MYTISIKYTAPVAPVEGQVTPICRLFYPGNCAADHPAMDGTYYDTNVAGRGEGTSLEGFMNQMVAHPGLVAALKKAIRDGEATFTTEDGKEAIYMEEVAGALAEQGFTIVVGNEDAAE